MKTKEDFDREQPRMELVAFLSVTMEDEQIKNNRGTTLSIQKIRTSSLQDPSFDTSTLPDGKCQTHVFFETLLYFVSRKMITNISEDSFYIDTTRMKQYLKDNAKDQNHRPYF